MTKRILAVMLACMMVLSFASFTAVADENAVYVEWEATGDGSESDPFGTIDEAILALDGEDGTIYIVGKYNISGFKAAAWDGTITFTGAYNDSAFTFDKHQAAIFNGDTIVKDIDIITDEYTHFNAPGVDFVLDLGDRQFPNYVHASTYGDVVVEEANFTLESGEIGILFTTGAYSFDVSSGVAGDSTITINDGVVDHIILGSDAYMDTMTGISVGGNLSLIINGGEIKKVGIDEQTIPEVMGALNIIFNNGMTMPEEFEYFDTAACGTYVIMSDKGGMVTPTAEPGVFNIKADTGMIAKIGGEEVRDGTVELEPGETEVKWVEGNQGSVITLTIDKAEIVTNGVATALDVPAQIINDRTMVPLRAIFEALGASVEWNNDTRTVTSKKGDTEISLTIDDTNLYVNGEAKVLDVPAQIVNDRTMVPARAIAEAYGCDVQWDGETRTVTITG